MDPELDAWGETWLGSQKKSSWELLRHPSKLVWWLGPGVHYGAFTFPFGQTITGTRWYKILHVNIEFSPPFKGTSGVSATELPCSWRTDNKLEYPRLNPGKKSGHRHTSWDLCAPHRVYMAISAPHHDLHEFCAARVVILCAFRFQWRSTAAECSSNNSGISLSWLPVIFAATTCIEHSIRPRRTNMEPSGTPEKDSSSVRLEQFHSHGKICVYKM